MKWPFGRRERVGRGGGANNTIRERWCSAIGQFTQIYQGTGVGCGGGWPGIVPSRGYRTWEGNRSG